MENVASRSELTSKSEKTTLHSAFSILHFFLSSCLSGLILDRERAK